LSEASIRAELLRTLWIADPNELILQEVGLLRGAFRADVVACGTRLAGFEIKSAADDLSRLEHQMRAYGAVFDTASVVVTVRHLRGVLEILPEWWGVLLATGTDDGTTLLSLREPEQNPSPDSVALASLLWKEEAAAILERTEAAVIRSSVTRRAAHKALAEALERDELRENVVRAMRLRVDWLPAYSPATCGD